MAKVCLDHFPKGSYPYQQSDGFWLDDNLRDNIDILADRITDDMQFVGIIGGSGTVRNGKSTLAQHIAYYYNYQVNKMHKLNNKFDVKNIVFKSNELMDLAFDLPPYSVIILDEGDDLTAQHYSHLAVKLRRFFRKCGQLNLFLILIIPDYFELPKTYAITRSTFLIDVQFKGNFQRGFFSFYSLKTKRMLYYKGKRYGDYGCVNSDFEGRFGASYLVDEKEYRKKKKQDMIEDNAGGGETVFSRKEKHVQYVQLMDKIADYKNIKFTQEEIARILNVSSTAVRRYIKEAQSKMEEEEMMKSTQPHNT